MFKPTLEALKNFSSLLYLYNNKRTLPVEGEFALFLLKEIFSNLSSTLVEYDGDTITIENYQKIYDKTYPIYQNLLDETLSKANFHFFVTSELMYMEAGSEKHTNSLSDLILALPHGVLKVFLEDLDEIESHIFLYNNKLADKEEEEDE
jgi:hypothetical protein